MSTRRKAATANAISNLYARVEMQERAVQFGFIFKSIPIVIVALYALYAVSIEPALINLNATIAVVALAALVLVFAFWRNDLLRSAVVFAT